MRAAELRNVDASTRSVLSSGTGDTKHVKDKRRNEGITIEPRKRKRGEPRLRDHRCSCPGLSDLSVNTHSLSCNTITSLPPPPGIVRDARSNSSRMSAALVRLVRGSQEAS